MRIIPTLIVFFLVCTGANALLIAPSHYNIGQVIEGQTYPFVLHIYHDSPFGGTASITSTCLEQEITVRMDSKDIHQVTLPMIFTNIKDTICPITVQISDPRSTVRIGASATVEYQLNTTIQQDLRIEIQQPVLEQFLGGITTISLYNYGNIRESGCAQILVNNQDLGCIPYDILPKSHTTFTIDIDPIAYLGNIPLSVITAHKNASAHILVVPVGVLNAQINANLQAECTAGVLTISGHITNSGTLGGIFSVSAVHGNAHDTLHIRCPAQCNQSINWTSILDCTTHSVQVRINLLDTILWEGVIPYEHKPKTAPLLFVTIGVGIIISALAIVLTRWLRVTV